MDSKREGSFGCRRWSIPIQTFRDGICIVEMLSDDEYFKEHSGVLGLLLHTRSLR